MTAQSVEVRAVALPKEAMRFVRFQWSIYEGDPHWVPPLLFERRQFLNPKKNPYFQNAEVQCFAAWRGGREVGTISAQIDAYYQQVEAGVGFFGFFEFIDDEAVARALLEEAKTWLRERGMARARGPFNFNSNHECGLLVDGFDADPVVMMTYNRDYYPAMYERLGLTKSEDLLAYWLEAGPVPARIAAIARRAESRIEGLQLRPIRLADFEAELAHARDIYNDAWSDNYGFVRFSDEEFEKVARGLKPMLDERLCWVAEIRGEAVAFAICLKDYNQVVKPMNGRLFPAGWWHWLTRPAKVDVLRILLLGVRRAYQKHPLGAPLYLRIWEEGLKMGVRGAEASWILESNYKMRGALEKLGARVYKTYRIYEADLGAPEESIIE